MQLLDVFDLLLADGLPVKDLGDQALDLVVRESRRSQLRQDLGDLFWRSSGRCQGLLEHDSLRKHFRRNTGSCQGSLNESSLGDVFLGESGNLHGVLEDLLHVVDDEVLAVERRSELGNEVDGVHVEAETGLAARKLLKKLPELQFGATLATGLNCFL